MQIHLRSAMPAEPDNQARGVASVEAKSTRPAARPFPALDERRNNKGVLDLEAGAQGPARQQR